MRMYANPLSPYSDETAVIQALSQLAIKIALQSFCDVLEKKETDDVA